MAPLTTKSRNALATNAFAGPDRSYPIEDASHARDALSRVSANGSPAVKAEVRAKVHREYPSIGESDSSPSGGGGRGHMGDWADKMHPLK